MDILIIKLENGRFITRFNPAQDYPDSPAELIDMAQNSATVAQVTSPVELCAFCKVEDLKKLIADGTVQIAYDADIGKKCNIDIKKIEQIGESELVILPSDLALSDMGSDEFVVCYAKD